MLTVDDQSIMMQRAPYSDGVNHAPIIFNYEIFKPVPGFNNRYFISSLGRLFDSKYQWHCKPVIGRYVRYYLQYGPNDFTEESAQKLMMITFKPDPEMENKMIVFLDQNPMNLVLDNLVWMTISEKHKYLAELGIMGGETVGRTKYTNEQIHRVCMLLEKGFSPEQIKRILVDLPEDGDTPFHSICSRIKSGASWKHIAKQYNLNPINRNLGPDLIHNVCRLLSQNKSSKEIALELNSSFEEYEQIKRLCNNLRARRAPYTKYTNLYPNIPYVTDTSLTDNDIELIMQLKSQGYSKIQILDSLKNIPNITHSKLYKLFRNLKKDPINARGADIARKYGII